MNTAVERACLTDDVEKAGGVETLILLAKDISSALDASTETRLWEGLRAHRITVIGATSKRAALAHADKVVVLVDGHVVAVGPWAELASSWGHLAG